MSATASLLIASIVIAVIVLYFNALEYLRRRSFASRSQPIVDNWCRRHYRTEQELDPVIVNAIIAVVSEAIHVDPAKLLPSDILSRYIYLRTWRDVDYSEELLEALLSDRFDRDISMDEHWATLDDLIRGVVRQVKSK